MLLPSRENRLQHKKTLAGVNNQTAPGESFRWFKKTKEEDRGERGKRGGRDKYNEGAKGETENKLRRKENP